MDADHIRDKPHVSIFIPVKDGAKTVGLLMDAIFAQMTDLSYEVVLIDSGSTDGTLDILRKYPVRLYEIRPQDFNHGSTRNQGIAHCRGDLVINIVQDAIPADRLWLDKMVRNFSDESVAGVFCRQIPWDHHDIFTKRQLNIWTGPEREIKCITDRDKYDKMKPVDKFRFCAFDNVCSCLRKEVWEKYKFEETEFAEDLIWGKKILENGFKIVYEPATAVIHSHDRSLWSEYKRNHITHQRLSELFGLASMPTRSVFLETLWWVLRDDLGYALKSQERFSKKIRTLAKASVRSPVLLYAQYRGARSKQAMTGKS